MQTLNYKQAVRAFELGKTVAICSELGTVMYGEHEIALELDAQVAFDWAERRNVPMILVDRSEFVDLPEPIPVAALPDFKKAEATNE